MTTESDLDGVDCDAVIAGCIAADRRSTIAFCERLEAKYEGMASQYDRDPSKHAEQNRILWRGSASAVRGVIEYLRSGSPAAALTCSHAHPNGRLIAAAPDLLAALKALADSVEFRIDDPRAALRDAAPAAIAKATGGDK